MENRINDDLDLSSSDESDNESDNGSDMRLMIYLVINF